MSYFDFLHRIDSKEINTIFELGSRDLVDAIKLIDCFENSIIYSFECNTDSLIECNKNLLKLEEDKKKKIFLIDKAVSIVDEDVTFYPFDLQKYNNMGASSMLKIDFSNRSKDDPDYNLPNPQKEIKVNGIRLDTFMDENKIENIDLLCMDLQGYELYALKSLGDKLHNVKYIITECSIKSTYTNGTNFKELNDYLNKYNFKYISSNRFGEIFPDLSSFGSKGIIEFDSFFSKQ